VALAIVVGILGPMLLTAVQARRQLLRERDLRQCELLLAAGLDRAARQIARDTTYEGETWTLTADATRGFAEGRVTIRVADDSQSASTQVKVTAEYPLAEETTIRRSFTGHLQNDTPLEEK
jgi:hypothetical protein